MKSIIAVLLHLDRSVCMHVCGTYLVCWDNNSCSCTQHLYNQLINAYLIYADSIAVPEVVCIRGEYTLLYNDAIDRLDRYIARHRSGLPAPQVAVVSSICTILAPAIHAHARLVILSASHCILASAKGYYLDWS